MTSLLGFAPLLLAFGWPADRRPLVTTFYPTYGYLDEAGDEWTIPLRVWVHSPHAKTQALVESAAGRLGITMAGRERELFGSRIADIVADSRSLRDVRFVFDGDPERQVFALPRTDLNGVVESSIKLSRARAEAILRAQRSNGWLTLRETSPGTKGSGRVVLIPREGRSVVSDIDDTIKVTEIPAGAEIVVRNTFLREFVAAPGMADRYRELTKAGYVFHFVSGGPWQLHGPLSTFLTGAGYPEGTFHMKEVTKNLLAVSTWEGFYALAQGDATPKQKVAQISELLSRFPQRRFTLIGDSGEQDPEVFREIRGRFGKQVEAIYIRHVLPGAPGERLAGMQVIAAEPVLAGVSRLGS
ncbi:MAG TPA: phosphatase domain-containing protein [Thermoanaerobaculia bacterium]|nr:phosphatase domain-containing protein [Thermoanaerobaculia bacterium]